MANTPPCRVCQKRLLEINDAVNPESLPRSMPKKLIASLAMQQEQPNTLGSKTCPKAAGKAVANSSAQQVPKAQRPLSRFTVASGAIGASSAQAWRNNAGSSPWRAHAILVARDRRIVYPAFEAVLTLSVADQLFRSLSANSKTASEVGTLPWCRLAGCRLSRISEELES